MLTICWAAKGGGGTTTYAVARALSSATPALLIDLAGDVPAVLGLLEPEGPGVHDWLRSESPPERLRAIEHEVTTGLTVITAGSAAPAAAPGRWDELSDHLRHETRVVIVDAGTARPPTALSAVVDERLLVTRNCYLALRKAAADGGAPTGIVLVEEPGRSFRTADVEASLGVPVVDTVLFDPAIARAVDAGLLAVRLPRAWRRHLGRVA